MEFILSESESFGRAGIIKLHKAVPGNINMRYPDDEFQVMSHFRFWENSIYLCVVCNPIQTSLYFGVTWTNR